VFDLLEGWGLGGCDAWTSFLRVDAEAGGG
jgi:hypothetical protein